MGLMGSMVCRDALSAWQRRGPPWGVVVQAPCVVAAKEAPMGFIPMEP